jgi:hypothetical protein
MSSLLQSATFYGPTVTANTATSSSLTSASIALACVGPAVKDGTVESVVVMKTTTTSSGAFKARLETLVAGNPSGVLLASGSEGTTGLTGGSFTNQVVTLDTPVAVTKGQPFAIVGRLSTFVSSVSFARAIAAMQTTAGSLLAIPGNRINNAFTEGSSSGWTNGTANTIGMMCPLFTDGSPAMLNTLAINGLPTLAVSGATSYGVRFTPGTTVDLDGVIDAGRTDSACYDLYDGENNLLASTVSVQGAASTQCTIFAFASPIRINAGVEVNLIKRSVSGTNSLILLDAYSSELASSLFSGMRSALLNGGVISGGNPTTIPSIALLASPVASGGGMMFPVSLTGGIAA